MDNVSWGPLDNETLEAPHSSSNLLDSYLFVKCTHLIGFEMESIMVLNCFRVVKRARMGKQMYFMPRENPEDEVPKKKHSFSYSKSLFSCLMYFSAA